MNRKDDHIKYALDQKHLTNDFDRVRFVPLALPSRSVLDVDLSTEFAGQTFPFPIYINAMTGGTNAAYEINQKLALIAKAFQLPIATGSLSAALKDAAEIPGFKVIRDTVENGFVIANIGVSKTADDALKAIEMINADALQVHLNAPQEIVMPEGDRDFSLWKKNLEEIIKKVDVPVIVKDVGFGLSRPSMEEIIKLGGTIIDVSGRGGTNFIAIENQRRQMPLDGLTAYGFSTVESLLEAKSLKGVTILASGGIRNPYDVVKALALGAKAVGLSQYFLNLITTHSVEEAINITAVFLEDIRKIMAILDCKNISALQQKELIFDAELLAFITQRNY